MQTDPTYLHKHLNFGDSFHCLHGANLVMINALVISARHVKQKQPLGGLEVLFVCAIHWARIVVATTT